MMIGSQWERVLPLCSENIKKDFQIKLFTDYFIWLFKYVLRIKYKSKNIFKKSV